MMFRKCPRWSIVPALAALLLLVAATTQETHYLQPVEIDVKAIIAAPPAEGSPEQKAEIEKMLALQAQRTPEEAARCKAESEMNPFIFASVLGDSFNAKNLPLTARLLDEVFHDTDGVALGAKKLWNRPRPPAADARIQPCVHPEKSTSYPSGHAARGIVLSTVLVEIFPDKKDQLLALGRQIGTDRTLAGIHYPSDVAAGQTIGEAIVAKILANPQFKIDLEKARAECSAVMQAGVHKNP
jgi:hypothetical protein